MSASSTSTRRSNSRQFTSLGGQALLEGVMMRSPRFVAAAVRLPLPAVPGDAGLGPIRLRSRAQRGLLARARLLRLPVLRGVIQLVESLLLGMEFLGYSAEILGDEGRGSRGGGGAAPASGSTSTATVVALIASIFFGLALFVGVPHLLALATTHLAGPWLDATLGWSAGPESFFFHASDGVLKAALVIGYMALIGRVPEIRRVFQFHGAEHKSIHAFEAGEDLTVENARRHPTAHPRCGTSFLLLLVIVGVAFFAVAFPLLGLGTLFDNPVLNHLGMVLAKIALMLPIAGVSYELMKFCAVRARLPLARLLLGPGIWVQRLTTREPDDGQLEVALASLRQVLRLEKGLAANAADDVEFDIANLADLGRVQATVLEFPE